MGQSSRRLAAWIRRRSCENGVCTDEETVVRSGGLRFGHLVDAIWRRALDVAGRGDHARLERGCRMGASLALVLWQATCDHLATVGIGTLLGGISENPRGAVEVGVDDMRRHRVSPSPPPPAILRGNRSAPDSLVHSRPRR